LRAALAAARPSPWGAVVLLMIGSFVRSVVEQFAQVGVFSFAQVGAGSVAQRRGAVCTGGQDRNALQAFEWARQRLQAAARCTATLLCHCYHALLLSHAEPNRSRNADSAPLCGPATGWLGTAGPCGGAGPSADTSRGAAPSEAAVELVPPFHSRVALFVCPLPPMLPRWHPGNLLQRAPLTACGGRQQRGKRVVRWFPLLPAAVPFPHVGGSFAGGRPDVRHSCRRKPRFGPQAG